MLNNAKEMLKYTFSSAACLICLAVLFFMFGIDFATSLILTVLLGAFLYYRSGNDKRTSSRSTYSRKKSTSLNRVSSEKEAFYQSKGLTKEEMNTFRNAMQEAREQIYNIEENINSRSKLKAIMTRNNTLNILKDFFKNIADQPERLHEVNHFLYTHLPNLKELTQQYIQIDGHVAKSKETYDFLNKSSSTIDHMCQIIRKDYITFMSNDLENMDVEIELANHVLKRDHEDTTVSEPSEKEI
ncbi:5-bromo-4-chloroindolyl phosphate hydrolysis family protein [Jeotgalibaca sp. MA1X17-3]|uniref:5-bromo-4-chloroindolyl phosphate hydrolysis family protein n=1 Tax=Jeotgalibaca sp. MA1X17-3 TaxID=2908211 RepID=UPI001F187652|nr:5-bromo-4-chloroindolyl phosphate hydrolysis family protein [Jeotgalibaca sp. MA1X17-3]UJF15114.1 5-bromo-4-chloroindolyl phosphate hydrolysis family protein [Jeotgalibaca sp. MA1X17-3]